MVENRAGAAGNIGVEVAARAAPDGYTFFLGNVGTIAINPAYFPNLPVKPTKDFIAVTQVVDVPGVLVAHPHFPPNNVKELVAYAQGEPGQAQLRLARQRQPQPPRDGDAAQGRPAWTWCTSPTRAAPVRRSPAWSAGETHLMFVTVSSAIGHVKGGRLKALARVRAPKRSRRCRDVPTMAEPGYPDLTGGSWQGIFVPAGTPKEIVERLLPRCMQTMKSPEVVAAPVEGRRESWRPAPRPRRSPSSSPPRPQRWGRVVKESGATPD